METKEEFKVKPFSRLNHTPMRKAIIEYDYLVKAKVEKPKKRKKEWVDQFEVIAATPYQARDKVECECKQKGWRFMRTIQIEKKGLAFAFWEDNYEFLTEEELKEATTVNWPG
jgi:hypothetical protein